jgi:hypothetical protein
LRRPSRAHASQDRADADQGAGMSQRLAHSHAEALVNAITGLIIAQFVLWLFGISLAEAVFLNVTMIAISYLRAFLIRRAFEAAE